MDKSPSAALIAEIVFLAACPALAFWVMHFTPIAQRGYLDPYIYTGYINNFEDLFQRYGATYYGVRFGLIAPAQVAGALFGPLGGYFALRYVYALIAGIPFYALVKQRFGRTTALATFVVLLTSPYFARTVLWDHPDAAGVPFLFAAVSLFLVEYRRRWLLDLFAGVCAGLAVHSNVFVAAPLAIFFACYMVLWLLWRRGVLAILLRLLSILVGVAVVTAIASAYYWWRVALPDMFSITLEVSAGLAAGGMAAWRTSGFDWVTRQWSVLTPVFLIILALLTWSRRRVTFQDAAIWTAAVGITSFFYGVQFLANGNSLELFYYFSYLLPFVFLLLALIAGRVWNDATERTRVCGAFLLLSAAIGPWLLHSFGIHIAPPISFSRHLAVVGAALAGVALWQLLPRYRTITSLCSATALGLMFFTSFQPVVYAAMLASRNEPAQREIDVYNVALQFIENVPKSPARPGPIAFWYSNEPPGNSIQSVQSTYLWGFSKIQGQGRGLPYLEESEIERLRRMQLKWLVLLAEKDGELAQGRDALRRLNVNHAVVDRRVLSSKTYTLHFELLELRQ